MTVKLITENNIQYTVETHASGAKYWYLNGNLHREYGPAIERADGSKEWYLNDIKLTEEEHKKAVMHLRAPTCEGKVVEIDGKKYKLTAV